MNNEPVAWMYESKNVDGKPYISDVSLKPLFGLVTRYGYKEIPLYTHPAQKPMMVLDGNRVYPAFKELTDEEILIICFDTGITSWKLSDGNMDAEMMLEFARAILRKAQNG